MWKFKEQEFSQNCYISMSKHKRLVLPTLRGKMGDWYYYVTLLPFKEISERVSMVPEIHKSEGLSRLIQREVSGRTKDIVEYLKTQEQRFFNSLILGLYGGKPYWQEISLIEDNINLEEDIGLELLDGIVYLKEEDLVYLRKTFGILILSGDEKIFAIDGQHRIKAIKDSLIDNKFLKNEEVATIFVAHKTTNDGVIRTRRLFSTINRYAKPVSISEIIAIDEEDNCAIITRNLVEEFDLLSDIVLFQKTRSISKKNTRAFTNIIVLYDFVKAILTNQSVLNIKVPGVELKKFISRRETEEVIAEKQKYMEDIFTELFEKIPSLKTFRKSRYTNRTKKKTSLLFRPIGQNIMYSVLKVAIENSFKDEAILYFAKDDFNLEHKVWGKVFWNNELNEMRTSKGFQNYAIYMILKHLGFNFKEREKEKEVYDSFGFTPMDI